MPLNEWWNPLFVILFVYLLICIHSLLEVIKTRRKLTKATDFTSAHRSRLLFYLLLLLAALTRLAVLVQQTIQSFQGDEPRSWEYDWLHLVPVLFFLSAFSVIVVFFSRLYHATLSIHSTILSSFYYYLNLITYIVFLFISIFTLGQQPNSTTMTAFKRQSFICFAISFYISAGALFYYGYHISTSLSNAIYIRSGLDPRSFLKKRCLLLMIVIGSVFTLRGTFFLAESFLKSEFRPSFLSDVVWEVCYFLMAEGLPSIFCCYLLNVKPKKNKKADTLLVNVEG
ncbi:hypothetical protein P9112_009501 [Eukaryota sp. TZLM1-RC]